MTVGIVGLGLIGGSFAKAYTAAGHTVLADDLDRSILSYASLRGDIAGVLTAERLGECELLLLCTYVDGALRYLEEHGSQISDRTLVADCCGTKRRVTEGAGRVAAAYGFTYVGCHPMAGKQYSGFKHAKEDLFRGAPMAVVPPRFDDIRLLERIKALFAPAGFGRFVVTTAEEHDRIIAFSSQLAHVVSSAYIKSPTATDCKGVSAGSYRDMTRVAQMNEGMWTDLFLENRDRLSEEIGWIVARLEEYRKALDEADSDTLRALIREGSARKKEVDG